MTDAFTYIGPPVARKVTFYEARRHFLAGGDLLVTERPEGPERMVHPGTTVNYGKAGDVAAWDELAAQVRMWRSRYPRQTFYAVPTRQGVAS